MTVSPRFAIVTTTINVPRLLTAYAKDCQRFARNVEFIVVGDKKTPRETSDFCSSLEQNFQLKCAYISVAEQVSMIASWPSFSDFLPWNCIQRRNLGMLRAYQQGFDVVVTIDDDNLLCDTDYLGRHANVGQARTVDAVHSESGWWNVCEMLEEARSLPFYHRGHPLEQRWLEDSEYRTISKATGRIAVNAGLWLDDPDIDALTRLYAPIRTVRRNPEFAEQVACEIGTWAPFNSQNTALARDVIPAYCLFPRCGRYDDIWASYVVRRIADHLGDLVTYGSPLVRQKRNAHNLHRDLDEERVGMQYTDAFVKALTSCSVTAQDYRGCFAELANQIEEKLSQHCALRKLDVTPLSPLIRGFHEWTQLF